jgi:hypothetical protein
MLSPMKNLATAALRIVVRDTDQDHYDGGDGLRFGAADLDARHHRFIRSLVHVDGAGGRPVEFSQAGNNLGRWLPNQHSAAGTVVCPRGPRPTFGARPLTGNGSFYRAPKRMNMLTQSHDQNSPFASSHLFLAYP